MATYDAGHQNGARLLIEYDDTTKFITRIICENKGVAGHRLVAYSPGSQRNTIREQIEFPVDPVSFELDVTAKKHKMVWATEDDGTGGHWELPFNLHRS